MTNMPGNANSLTHEEVLKTHLDPDKQPKAGTDYPKMVGDKVYKNKAELEKADREQIAAAQKNAPPAPPAKK